MRLPEFDYSTPGLYYVTICTHDHLCLFGEIEYGVLQPSPPGLIVQACWNEIPAHYPFVEPDAFSLMPNHLHGLLHFAVGVGHARPLPAVIGSFKAAVSRRSSPGIWQRNYWERVVRTEKEADSIRNYIDANPSRWANDRENLRRHTPPRPIDNFTHP